MENFYPGTPRVVGPDLSHCVTNNGKYKYVRSKMLSLQTRYHLSLALKAIYPPLAVWHTPIAVTPALRNLGRRVTVPSQADYVSQY